MTIDTQEFHELMMDYRGARPLSAQDAYEKVVAMVEGYCERQVGRETGLLKLVLGDTQLDLKHAREAHTNLEAHCLRLMDKLATQPPAYIGMSQAGLGAEAHGYVRGWNDCVDAVINKENM